MQNEDKIKAAIAEFLARETTSVLWCQSQAEKIFEYAIAPHLEASQDWAEAPEWARWRTVDEDGTITFWEMKPEKGRDSWHHGSIRSGITECVQKEEKEWYSSLRRRPE